MDKGSISCHTKHAQAGGAIPAAFTMPSKPPKQALRRAKVLPGNLQLLQVAPPGGGLCNWCRGRHNFANYKAIQVNGTCWPNSWLNLRLLNVCGCTKVTVDPQDSCCTKSVGMHGDWGGPGGLGGHVRPSDKTWRRLQLIFHCPNNAALYNIQHCTTLYCTLHLLYYIALHTLALILRSRQWIREAYQWVRNTRSWHRIVIRIVAFSSPRIGRGSKDRIMTHDDDFEKLMMVMT